MSDVDLTHRPRGINAEFIDRLTHDPIFRVTGGEVYETGDGKLLNCVQIEAEDGYIYLYNPNVTVLKLFNKAGFYKTDDMVEHHIKFYTIAVEVAGKSRRGIRIAEILSPDKKKTVFKQETLE